MTTRSLNRTAILLLLCVISTERGLCSSVRAGEPGAPENWEARFLLRDAISAPVRQASALGRRIVVQKQIGDRVSFSARVEGDALFLEFANQREDGTRRRTGSFVFERSLKDGRFLRAKVYIQDDIGCYLSLFPRDERTAMDVFLFGERVRKSIMLPVSFGVLLTAPLSRIVELTGGSVDWPVVFPPTPSEGDRRLEILVERLRPLLPSLPDREDGAMDRDGRLVLIATGAAASRGRGGFNCSGFAKWVVDGFYKPLTGAYIDIPSLKERGLRRGGRGGSPQDEERDLYFGLDWARNLARVLDEARKGIRGNTAAQGLPLTPREADVRETDHAPFLEEAGYSLRSARGVLYFLARRNPGTIYLGSVNGMGPIGVAGTPYPEEGEGGDLRPGHHHLVVFFPFFDSEGAFRVVVMERNVETTLESLLSRFPQEYVYLVRLDSSGDFNPPKIE
jgi:hypothetical protein